MVLTWLGLVALAAISTKATTELAPGAKIAGKVRGTEPSSYTLHLRAGDSAWLTLKQGGIDLTVLTIAPDGHNETHNAFEMGPEPITISAGQAGPYKLEVRCAQPCASAAYVLELNDVHPTGNRDTERSQAARNCAEARSLAESKPSLEAAASVATQAAAKFHDLTEAAHEASALVIAGTAHFSQNKYERAEEVFRRALALTPGSDFAGAADVLNDIGLCRRYRGFPDEALEFYLQAADKWKRVESRTQGEASTLSNIGVLYCQLGECNQSIEFYRRALNILKSYNQPQMRALALHNLGAAYGVLGDNRSASYYIEASLSLFRKVKAKSPALARALTNLALVRVEQERYDQAQSLEREALGMAGEDERARADVLTDLCKTTNLMRRPAEAVDLCQEAIGLYRHIGEPRGEGAALHNLGTAQAALGQFQEARSTLDSARAIRQSIKIPSSVIETMTRLAKVQASAGDMEAALESAGEAVKVAESLRAKVVAEKLRTSYFAAKQSSYETYVDVLMRLNETKPDGGYDVRAFETAELRRARTLLDLLGEARNEIDGESAPEVRQDERRLIRRLNYLNNAKAPFKEIDSELRELELVQAKLRERDSRVAELLTPPPPKLESIRDQLGPDDALIEYSLGDERSYAWVLTKAQLKSYVLPPRERINKLASRVADKMSQFRGRAKNANANSELRRSISSLRAVVLGMELKARRVIVVPDGSLQLAPFAALLPDGREIISLPSASTLVSMRAAPRVPARHGIEIFADPVFDSTDPRVHNPKGARQTPSRRLEPALPRLVFSRDEASSIARMVPADQSRVRLDFNATKQEFLSPATTHFRYVHLSSHAIIDTDRPELSSIVLTRIGPNGEPVDGQVRLYELYRFHVGAELVTLGACNTGVGQQMSGEGLVGLTRAFLFAGAKSVLVTLWPVEDEGTATFMEAFYSNLLTKGMKPSSALTAAQQKMRREPRWQDPYYWAGFALQGDWR